MVTLKASGSRFAYPLLAGGLLLSGATLALTRPTLFTPYFGAHPLPVMLAVVVAGYYLLTLLRQQFGFEVWRPERPVRGPLVAVAASLPFMVLVTGADLIWRFPADINVALPEALLFYPVMGFAAQIVMHLAPLALLLVAVGRLRKRPVLGAGFWVPAALVAAIESGFQLAGGRAVESVWQLNLFVACHLWLFGLTELAIFRRYDYLSMYAFRLSYYGYWHLLWGGVRLEVLF